MKKRARVSPVIKTAIFVSVIVFLIGFSYNNTNPSYGRIDSPTSNSDANTKNNSSIIYQILRNRLDNLNLLQVLL